MAAMNEAEVTLAILAGGRGERMGKAKGLLQIRDQPILAYLLEQFEWEGPTMLVTSPGREHPPGAELFDREVVDPVEGMGPVRGLMTALENATTSMVVVTSVDLPLVQKEQLTFLAQMLQGQPWKPGVMLERPKHFRPFPCILAVGTKEAIANHLQSGERSLASLFRVLRLIPVEIPADWPDEIWTNLNEPADLARFKEITSYRIH
jgi:molybdopterin-guanine dinucleotide biosynthesis protein A